MNPPMKMKKANWSENDESEEGKSENIGVPLWWWEKLRRSLKQVEERRQKVWTRVKCTKIFNRKFILADLLETGETSKKITPKIFWLCSKELWKKRSRKLRILKKRTNLLRSADLLETGKTSCQMHKNFQSKIHLDSEKNMDSQIIRPKI